MLVAIIGDCKQQAEIKKGDGDDDGAAKHRWAPPLLPGFLVCYVRIGFGEIVGRMSALDREGNERDEDCQTVNR